jgi:ATP-dependent Lon protease
VIGEKYLIPTILKQYKFENLLMTEDAWSWILNDRKEPGVRELKRDLETLISRLNVLQILKMKSKDGEMYCPKNLVIPNVFEWDATKPLSQSQVEALLKDRTRKNDIPMGLYI